MNFFWFFYHDDVTTMGPEPLSVIDPASDNDRASCMRIKGHSNGHSHP